MWLRKARGGTQIGPYEWPADGSVTEVDDEFGRTLLAIPEGGFEKVDGPDPAPEITEAGEAESSADPKRRASARKTAVTE